MLEIVSGTNVIGTLILPVRELLERPFGSDDTISETRMLPSDKVAQISKYIFHNRRIAGSVMINFTAVLTKKAVSIPLSVSEEQSEDQSEEHSEVQCLLPKNFPNLTRMLPRNTLF